MNKILFYRDDVKKLKTNNINHNIWNAFKYTYPILTWHDFATSVTLCNFELEQKSVNRGDG